MRRNRYRNPVSVSRTVPKGMSGLFPSFQELAPSYELLNAYRNRSIDESGYVNGYIDGLESLAGGRGGEEAMRASVLSSLSETAGESGEATLICWEKTGEFCHRYMLQDWLGGKSLENVRSDWLRKIRERQESIEARQGVSVHRYTAESARGAEEEAGALFRAEDGRTLEEIRADGRSGEFAAGKMAAIAACYAGSGFQDPPVITLLGSDDREKGIRYGDTGHMARLARMGGSIVFDFRTSKGRDSFSSFMDRLEDMSRDEISAFLERHSAERTPVQPSGREDPGKEAGISRDGQDVKGMEDGGGMPLDDILGAVRSAAEAADRAAPVLPDTERKAESIRYRLSSMTHEPEGRGPYGFLEAGFAPMESIRSVRVGKMMEDIGEPVSFYRSIADGRPLDIGKIVKSTALSYVPGTSFGELGSADTVEGIAEAAEDIVRRFVSDEAVLRSYDEGNGRLLLDAAERGASAFISSLREAGTTIAMETGLKHAMAAAMAEKDPSTGFRGDLFASAGRDGCRAFFSSLLDRDPGLQGADDLLRRMDADPRYRKQAESAYRTAYVSMLGEISSSIFRIFGSGEGNIISQDAEKLGRAVAEREGAGSPDVEIAAVRWPVLRAAALYQELSPSLRKDIGKLRGQNGLTLSENAVAAIGKTAGPGIRNVPAEARSGILPEPGGLPLHESGTDGRASFRDAFSCILCMASSGRLLLPADYGKGYLRDALDASSRNLADSIALYAATAPAAGAAGLEKASKEDKGTVFRDEAAAAVFERIVRGVHLRPELFRVGKSGLGKAQGIDRARVVISGGPAMDVPDPDQMIPHDAYTLSDDSPESYGALYRTWIEAVLGVHTGFNAAHEVGRPDSPHTEEEEERAALDEYMEMSAAGEKAGEKAVEFHRIRDAIDPIGRRLDESAPMPDFEGQAAAHAKDEAESGLGYLRPGETVESYAIGRARFRGYAAMFSRFADAITKGEKPSPSDSRAVRRIVGEDYPLRDGERPKEITDEKIAEVWNAIERDNAFTSSIDVRDSLFDVAFDIGAKAERQRNGEHLKPSETRFSLPPIYRSVTDYLSAYAESFMDTGDRAAFRRIALFPKSVSLIGGHIVPDWEKGVNPAYTENAARLYLSSLREFAARSGGHSGDMKESIERDIAAIGEMARSESIMKRFPLEREYRERTEAGLAAAFFRTVPDHLVKGLSYVPVRDWPVTGSENVSLDERRAYEAVRDAMGKAGLDFRTFDERERLGKGKDSPSAAERQDAGASGGRGDR